MAAVAIDTARLALVDIPEAQRQVDSITGGRFQVQRVSVYATIPCPDSEVEIQSRSEFHGSRKFDVLMPNPKALDWRADPDDDMGDADDLGDEAVLHHLHQQAATVPVLSSLLSQRDHGNAAATTLTGSAWSANFNAKMQGRLLSSFHRYSLRTSSVKLSLSKFDSEKLVLRSNASAHFPPDGYTQQPAPFHSQYKNNDPYLHLVCVGTRRYNFLVFWQVQWDVVDLLSRRALPASRPAKRRRTAFNQFLQLSDSPVVKDTSRENPQGPHARRFKGVRYRPERRMWVAEMKPRKHKSKQDFGNFKLEAEAARAVDAAFHHYGKPELLNFPATSLQFLCTRPAAPPGLDAKAKVKFVKEEARLLLAAVAATSAPLSTPTNSVSVLEPESPRRCPSSQFRSVSEFSWPLSCFGPGEVASHPQPQGLLDPVCGVSTTAVEANLESVTSVLNAEQGWGCAEDSFSLAAPPRVATPSTHQIQIQSTWLDSLIQSPPAPTYSRSPSPSRFQEEIAHASLEQQSFSAC